MSGSTGPTIWVHGDCLSPANPALARYPEAPAIFVFDDELIDGLGISLKRLVFIYECLLEMPVTIRRGDVAAEVTGFAGAHCADRVITTASPSPRFRTIKSAIERSLPVEVMPVEQLVNYGGELDLGRFSRYWRTAEPFAFGAHEQMKLWK